MRVRALSKLKIVTHRQQLHICCLQQSSPLSLRVDRHESVAVCLSGAAPGEAVPVSHLWQGARPPTYDNAAAWLASVARELRQPPPNVGSVFVQAALLMQVSRSFQSLCACVLSRTKLLKASFPIIRVWGLVSMVEGGLQKRVHESCPG
jgi:hypothetical protein